eukprot:7669802-Alexandrium_andersonii.AAC.1
MWGALRNPSSDLVQPRGVERVPTHEWGGSRDSLKAQYKWRNSLVGDVTLMGWQQGFSRGPMGIE